MNKKIQVNSEYSKLKTVVLAESEFYIQEFNSPHTIGFLPDTTIQDINIYNSYNLNNTDPNRAYLWEQERIELKNILESYGIEVIRPRKLSTIEKNDSIKSFKGYSNFFVRDPFFVIDNLLIEGNLKFPHRKSEIIPLKPILEYYETKTKCKYLSINNMIYEGAGAYLEGGDIIICGKTIFVGYSGLASNLKGIFALSQILKETNYEVVPVKLDPDILHLDCVLSLVRDGLMIVCVEAFVNGIPEKLKSWDKIRVTKKDAKNLIVNGLSIDESTYITDSSFKNLIKELEKYKIKVETLDFSLTRSYGGSIRCSTQALLREDNTKNEI